MLLEKTPQPPSFDGLLGPKQVIRSFGPLGPFYPALSYLRNVGKVYVPPAKPFEIPDLQVAPTLAVEAETSQSLPPSVKSWKFSHANAKIRREAKSYRFPSVEGKFGVIQATKLPCNEPCEDEMDIRVGEGVGAKPALFAGVYDGHGGWATAKLLANVLISRVSKSVRHLNTEASNNEVDRAISNSFKKLDDELIRNAQLAIVDSEPADPDVITAIAPAVSGACALLSIYEPSSSTFRVACVGDSRAVLAVSSGDAYEAKALSVEQGGSDVGEGNLEEFARVKAEHPGEEGLFDNIGRLFGLMVTRAFGDLTWKTTQDTAKKIFNEFNGPAPKPKVKTPPYVTAEPVITTTMVKGDDFAILASDGFWDHISSEDAVLCVSQWLKMKKDTNPSSFAHQHNLGQFFGEWPEPSMSHEVEYVHGYPVWFTRPEHFVVEDLDNAAVHLMKNVLGGKRRKLFTSLTMMYNPLARARKDDITIQVIFFGGINGAE